MMACILALFLQLLPLRFAWLSDPHVGINGAAHALEVAVNQLNARDDIRFVLLSGDITEMGSTEELLTARRILDRLRYPYHIIPGNHDTKWSESGTTAFAQLFRSDHFCALHGGYAFLGFHQGPLMRMADGHLAPQDLRWVNRVLAVLRQTNTPVIIVTHYPIDSSVANWYELLDRLDGNDVRLFLVGHGHENEVLSFEGYPGLMCRAVIDGKGEGPRRGRLYSPAACWPVASGRRLFIVAPDRAMTVLDCFTGKEIWRSKSHQERESIGITSADSALVFVRTMRDSLIAFDAHADTPVERWVATPGFAYEINAAMPVEKDGMLFYGSQRGQIFALNALNGTLRWTYRVGAVAVNTITPVDRHSILASDFDGNVMLLGCADDE